MLQIILDLTYENYYAEGSYFAIGYWRKIVDNFLQTRITQESRKRNS